MKLINPLEDDNAFLYHYTSSDTALRHILKTGTLLFNSFGKVNDPRESKHWDISPHVRGNIELELEQYVEISREVSEILKSNAKLICFSEDKPESRNAWQPEALLKRGFAKPSMWHHYGKGHDGVCFMFNREKLYEIISEQVNSQQLFHGQVIYSDQGILTKLQKDPFIVDLLSVEDQESYFYAIQNHFEVWYEDLFLKKLSDWSNEDEYRFVYLDDESKPRLIHFGDALEAIVIGEKAAKHNYDDFLRYCVIYQADIAGLIWRNGYPKIEHPGQLYITHRHLLD